MPQPGQITARVQLLDTSGLVSYTGNSSNSLYIWGAQIEFEQYEHQLKKYIDDYNYIRTRGVTSTAISLFFEPDYRLDFVEAQNTNYLWINKQAKLVADHAEYAGNQLIWSERFFTSSWTTTAASIQTIDYASSWVITFRSNLIPRTTSISAQCYDYPYGVAVDSTGNSYVAARVYPPPAFTFKSSVAMVVKIDTSGSILWNRVLGNNFTTGSTSLFQDVVIDSSETNVYGIGYSVNAGQSNNAHIVRMRASDGTVVGTTPVWTLSSDGSEYWRTGKRIGTDIYALGSIDQANDGILIAKYSAAGNGALTWQRLFGNVPQAAFGFGLDIGNSGNIYMGGYDNQSGNAVLVALNSTPSILWQKQFNHTSTAIRTSSQCYTVMCDRAESVYTVGRGAGADGFGGTYDIFVDKWTSSNGTLVWSRRFGDASGGQNTVGGAVDPDEDYLYIAFRQDSLGLYASESSNSLGNGIGLVKLDFSGNVVWRRALTFNVGPGQEFRWIFNDSYNPITVRNGYIHFTATNYTGFYRSNGEGGMMVLARFRTDGTDLGDYGQYTYKDASLLIGAANFTSMTIINTAYGLATTVLTSTLTTVGASNFNFTSSFALEYGSGTTIETAPVTGLTYNSSLGLHTGAAVFGNSIAGSSLLAQYLIHDTSNAEHSITQTMSVMAGVTYTASIWAKSLNSDIGLFIRTGSSNTAVFDSYWGFATSDSITAYANGWYRCATNFVAETSTLTIGTWDLYGNTSVYAGSGTTSDSVLIWGAQVIPTYSPNEYTQTQTTSAVTSSITTQVLSDTDPVAPQENADLGTVKVLKETPSATDDRRRIPAERTIDANRVMGLELVPAANQTFSLGLYTPADGDNIYYEAWDWFSEVDRRARARQATGLDTLVQFVDKPIFESRSIPRNQIFDAGQVMETFVYKDTDTVIDLSLYTPITNNESYTTNTIYYDKYNWYSPVPRSDYARVALGNTDGVGVWTTDRLGYWYINEFQVINTIDQLFPYAQQNDSTTALESSQLLLNGNEVNIEITGDLQTLSGSLDLQTYTDTAFDLFI